MRKLNTNQSVIQRLLERYPRGGAWMRMFFMFVLIMLSSTSVKAALEFGIKVAGVEVTSNMRYDLTEIPGVSGKVSFDPNLRTLTLENAIIESDEVGIVGIYNESCSDLCIEIIGTCTITSNGSSPIHLCESTYIYGTNGSKLILQVKSNVGALVFEGAPLEIKNCTVEAEGGYWGITGYGNDTEVLTIRNSVVKAKISNKDQGRGSLYDVGNLVLDGCSIIEPSGAAFDKTLKGVALNGQVVKDEVVIAPTVENYGIKIANKEVTRENCADLSVIDGVSGKVSFDPATKTLTLDNATITYSKGIFPGIANNEVDDLTIKLIGENKVTTKKTSLGLFKPTTITGNGSLYVTSENDCGIDMKDTPITIEDTRVYVKSGMYGIAGYSASDPEVLTIRNSNVEVEGTIGGSVAFLKNLILDGCSITQPAGAAFDAAVKGVALNGQVVKDEVVIAPTVENYGIKIANKEVTRENCADLSVIDGVSGKVSFDPATKTLTLDNATITYSKGIFPGIANNEVDDLTIKLIGENKVTTKKTSLGLFKPTTITGNGSLYVTSENDCGIDMKDTPITIEDTRVYVKSGMYGIAGYSASDPEVLTIRNSNVEVEGTIGGSVAFLKNLILDGCSITQPAGAAFDAKLKGVALNGGLVKDKVVIEPDASGINDITVDVPARKQGIFTVEGVKLTQQWENLPAGVYIVNGKKCVKR